MAIEDLKDLKMNSLRFITGVRYFKDRLDRLNNITYIYDKNWDINNTTKVTFPVCFFHVKSCHETMTSEVSQKQMLFYNSASEKTASDPSLNSGLLNVVADNIVIKPKVYKLDVVIPYKDLILIDSSMATAQINAINKIILNSASGSMDSNTRLITAWATMSAPYMAFIKGIIMNLTGLSVTDVQDWLSNAVQQPDFNKQSLEIMWKMRHIVKMKMWNSWDYKYVSIIDVDITKEGTEDGVYEATLTLQEMPIVTMYGKSETKGVNARIEKVKEAVAEATETETVTAELTEAVTETVDNTLYALPKRGRDQILQRNGEKVIEILEKAGGETGRKKFEILGLDKVK